MIRTFAAILFLIPAMAFGQTLPALYDVNGVAVSDTLNVRTGPSTQFDVIEKLAPDAEDLEVVDLDKTGEWGLINVKETSGWVSLKFMKRQAGQVEEGLPRAFACYGTEPFWSFTVAPDLSATFDEPSDAGTRQTRIDALVVVPSANRTDRHALFGDGGEQIFTTMVGHNQCFDGMSDRTYGLSIDLLVSNQDGVNVYSGCCSVEQ
ncbi:MAG: SH3 domain-containing protein [Pseudomonadota bacterium]